MKDFELKIEFGVVWWRRSGNETWQVSKKDIPTVIGNILLKKK